MALTVEDYESIRQLFARLAFNLDHGNAEAYADDYTDDGSFEVLGLPDGAEHAGKSSNRSGLMDFCNTLFSGTQGHCRHWNQNFVFTEETADTAKVTSYLQVLRIGEAPYSGVILTAVYHDELVKRGGRWFMRTRFVRADPQPGYEAPSTDVLVVRRDDFVNALSAAVNA